MTRKTATYLMLSLLAAAMLTSCRRHRETLSDRLNVLSEISELGTVEYTFSRLCAVDGTCLYKVGTRKAIYEAKAYVKAGIRMDGFSPDDVMIDKAGGKVKVTLPAAEILSFSIPPEEIVSVYHHVSGLRDEFSPKERLEYAVKAENSMRASVDSTDIFRDAENNAALYFKAMLSHFGYDPQSVEIIFRHNENE